MRRSKAILSFALLIAFPASADPARDARRSVVVAHVGSKTITAGDVEDRMQQVPPYQLATFGDDPLARKRKFLDEVMIPDVLYALGAEDRHLDKQQPTSYALDHARSDAATRAIKKGVTAAAQIPMEDVKKYYAENQPRYDTPERYNVWRILCSSQKDAQDILDNVKKDSSLTNWNAQARDHSIDRATYLRGGNLGFVTLDGQSNETGLRADPGVMLAAVKVKDGEFVGQVIPEGPNFAVVWRRGTVGANHRGLSEVEAQIKDTLFKQRGDAEVKRVTDELRTRDLKDFSPGVLDTIDVTMAEGQIVPRKRPGQVAPSSSQ
jgi:peptidyl-prolyl cis-trans isomerase C